jgi:nucleoside-diphosphate-sugar epimerase
MKVFVAGATGAVGKSLVTQLLSAGYEVFAMSRSPQKAAALTKSGATGVVADAFDRTAIMTAVATAKPDVVIHQLTGLTGVTDYKNFDREFALTNRLRTEGLDNLLEAARAAGVRRFIAQSYGNWNYARTGTGLKTETDEFDPTPPKNQVESLDAIRYLESALANATGIEGIALRYGNFYGPGTGTAIGGNIARSAQKRQFPIIGSGAGVWSFIHIQDAAAAAVAAIQSGDPGVYNIVDDEPAPVSDWLPELARALSAKAPLHVPEWVGRIAAGEVGVSMMTQIRGTSNAKAKAALGWQPRFESYRTGFHTGLGRGTGTLAHRSA